MQELGVVDHRRPRRVRIVDLDGADDERYDDLARAGRVVAEISWAAAAEVRQAQHQVLWGCDALVILKNSWNIPDFGGDEGLRDLRDRGT
jgi:hypothetical protein